MLPINVAAGVAANVVVMVHLAFLAFVIGGVVLVLRRPHLWPYHVGCVAWGLYIEFTRVTCPLTTFEKWLRTQAGQVAYAGGFFERYVVSYVLPDGLPRPVQTTLVLVLLTLTAHGYHSLHRRGALLPVRR